MEIKKLLSNKGNFIDGPLIINPKIYTDERGYFYESWNKSTFDKDVGKETKFSQDNHSCSQIGVIRGLHYQISPKTQGKLVRCISGEIFDVAVDIRKSSPTFMEWGGLNLNNKNKLLLWIPAGFAHGFLSLKENSEVLYKASGSYSKVHERSINWRDPVINIKWPWQFDSYNEPKLSEKDAKAPFLEEAEIFN